MVLGTMYGEMTPVNDLVNLVSVFKYIKEKYIKEERIISISNEDTEAAEFMYILILIAVFCFSFPRSVLGFSGSGIFRK